MAKKKAPDETLLIKSLLEARDGQPRKRRGTPKSPGLVLGSSAVQEELIKQAIMDGLVEECEGPTPAGRKTTTPTLYVRVTAKGVEWATKPRTPKSVEELLALFQKLNDTLITPEKELEELRKQFDTFQQSFCEKAEKTFARREQELAEIRQAIGAFTSTMGSQVHAPAVAVIPVPPLTNSPTLDPDAVNFIRSWQQEKRTDCPLPELYRHLRQHSPNLSIGAFHDLLRSLYTSDRISLTGPPGSLDRMPSPELAVLISSEVMYYAHVARIDR